MKDCVRWIVKNTIKLSNVGFNISMQGLQPPEPITTLQIRDLDRNLQLVDRLNPWQ